MRFDVACLLVLVPLAIPACYSGAATADTSASGAGGSGGSGAGGTNATGGGGSGGSTTGDGLPCDVAQLMQDRCVSCHGSPPLTGVPMPLVSRADLLAPAPSDPSKTVGQRSLERMQDTAAPMPPKPASAPTPAEIATLQSWVNAGMPAGSCGSGTGGSGGGTGTPDPLNADPTCSSGTNWNGFSEGQTMGPGQACNQCHAGSGEAPVFIVAGTVYPTGHEPNSCNGANGQSGTFAGAKVVLTNANGGTLATINVNSAGNFLWQNPVPKPFYAKVTWNGKERVMSSAVSNGDCNTCHTATGANNAPGRITLPQ